MRPTLSVTAAVLALAAAAHLAAPPRAIAQGAPPDAPPPAAAPGGHAVHTVDLSIDNPRTGRALELRVRVPAAGVSADMPAQGWPVLVFSHGAGGSREAFGSLLELLATHGFASVAPTHGDSIELARRGGERVPGLMDRDGRRQLLRRVDLAGRVADCSLVLDAAHDIAARVADDTGQRVLLDTQRAAIGGHSAGAFTAQLAAGVRARGRAVGKRGFGLSSIADERFRAAVVISGQGTPTRALTADSWARVAVPMLVFAGSLDGSPPDMGRQTPASRREPFERSRGRDAGGPPAYLVDIAGATHSSYQGKASRAMAVERALGGQEADEAGDDASVQPADPDAVAAIVNAAVLRFLRAFLADDQSARDWLDSDAPAGELGELLGGQLVGLDDGQEGGAVGYRWK